MRLKRKNHKNDSKIVERSGTWGMANNYQDPGDVISKKSTIPLHIIINELDFVISSIITNLSKDIGFHKDFISLQSPINFRTDNHIFHQYYLLHKCG